MGKNNDLIALISKKLDKEIKEGYCGECKQTFVDKEGHAEVVHRRNLSGQNREGKKLLHHCPVCIDIPDGMFFANRDALKNHFMDSHNKSA